MLKLLLAAAVVVGVIVGAAAYSDQHHATGPVPTGPVQVNVTVQNPLGGGQGGGDQVVVP
jgi:hypothetical protein